MKQYTENQYDDDLTVGTDDYDDSYYTGSVDLFEFANDEESPISRLKSLILSIDWEITDEVLMQFNEELVDLRDIWAGDKINLIYVQALEKISKYIYQKKADSHPSAIKLLLTLYHNLEKIVSSDDLSEDQKKEILLEDVKRFESLKRHISKSAPVVEDAAPIEPPPVPKEPEEVAGSENDLLNLKAIVLGIDWEITDQDLNELRQEVVRLEEKFADSKPKLILLQGIGTLGAYIKLKKSDSHADVFKILHLFYDSLEKIVLTPLTLEEEKGILYPAVEKFNSFKALLGPSMSPESGTQNVEEQSGTVPTDSSTIMPAFADYSEGEVKGFQAEEEALALGDENTGVDTHVESFFTGSSFPEDGGPAPSGEAITDDIKKMALDGVNVEIDDEDESVSAPASIGLTPALEDIDSGDEEIEPPSDPQELELSDDLDMIGEDESPGFLSSEETDSGVEPSLTDEDGAGIDFSSLDKDTVLQGVDVETEADDDSDEDALPMMGEELAPALMENDEVSIYNAETVEDPTVLESVGADIVDSLGGFFDEEIKSHSLVSSKTDDADDVGDAGVSVEDAQTEELDKSSHVDLSAESAVEEITEEEKDIQLDHEEDEITFDDELDEQEPALFAEESFEEATAGDGGEGDSIAFMSDPDQEENLESLFDEGEFEQEVSDVEEDAAGEIAVAEESSPIALVEEDPSEDISIDSQLDSFFDTEEEALGDVETPFEAEREEAAEEMAVIEESSPGALVDDDSSEDSSIDDHLDSFFDTEDETLEDVETSLEVEREEAAEEIAVIEESSPGALVDDDSFEDSTIDDHLDSFFDMEDDALEEEVASFEADAEESIEEESLVVTPDIELPAEETIEQEEAEEEVVFELVEEESDTQASVADFSEPVDRQLDDSEEAEDAALAAAEGSHDDEAGDEIVEGFTEDFAPILEDEKFEDAFGALQTCVDSLGFELDDKVLLGLWGEIDHLSKILVDKPLEKTFLQLLSTLAKHIDQNRYDANAEAFSLLKSVSGALTDLQDNDLKRNQEMLFAETQKVLSFQEDVLAQFAAESEAELTIGDSLVTEDHAENDVEFFPAEPDEVDHDDQLTGEESGMEEAESHQGEPEVLSEDFKDEISSLRRTLQDEIEELRKELKGD